MGTKLKMIPGRHFLRADFTASSGGEPAWTIGETRSTTGRIELCDRGYHSCVDWYDCLEYAGGPLACIVEVSTPVESDETKRVSRTRKLVAARNVEREMRLFACECADRALTREREAGREPDPRCWQAVEVARKFANGEATADEMYAAREAAREAAWGAAREAAREAAWGAAREAERAWQRARFDEVIDAAFAAEVTT